MATAKIAHYLKKIGEIALTLSEYCESKGVAYEAGLYLYSGKWRLVSNFGYGHIDSGIAFPHKAVNGQLFYLTEDIGSLH